MQWKLHVGFGGRTRGNPPAEKVGRALRSDPYTQHPTGEGQVYLAVVMDAWNREVIGWSIDNHIRAEITTQVLGETEWTPKVLERRQQQLIGALKKEWRLD